MNIRKHFGIILALSAMTLLGLSSIAGAQMGPGMMGNGFQSLTPEKQAAAQKIYSEHFAQTNTLRQQYIAKQYELNALIYGGKADDKKVQALTKEVSELRTKLFESQVALQQQLAKENIPVMGYGMGRGMGGGMGYGMGGGMMGPGMMGY